MLPHSPPQSPVESQHRLWHVGSSLKTFHWVPIPSEYKPSSLERPRKLLVSRQHHLPPQLLPLCLSGSLSSRNAGFLSSLGNFQPCCGLRASEFCFPFPQSPFPRETHFLTSFRSLLLYHLPSEVFIGCFTKNCKPRCCTHWHVLFCSVLPHRMWRQLASFSPHPAAWRHGYGGAAETKSCPVCGLFSAGRCNKGYS